MKIPAETKRFVFFTIISIASGDRVTKLLSSFSSTKTRFQVRWANRVKPSCILGSTFLHRHLNSPCSSPRHLKTHCCTHLDGLPACGNHTKTTREFTWNCWGGGEKGNCVCTTVQRLQHLPGGEKHSFFGWGGFNFLQPYRSRAHQPQVNRNKKWCAVESRRGDGEGKRDCYSYIAVIRHAGFMGPEREVSRRCLPLWPNTAGSRRLVCWALPLTLLMQFIQQLFWGKFCILIPGAEVSICP